MSKEITNQQPAEAEESKLDTPDKIPLFKMKYKLRGSQLDWEMKPTGNFYTLTPDESEFLKGFLETVYDMIDDHKITMTSTAMEELRSIYYGELLHAVSENKLSEEFRAIKVNFSFSMRSNALDMIFLEDDGTNQNKNKIIYTEDIT